MRLVMVAVSLFAASCSNAAPPSREPAAGGGASAVSVARVHGTAPAGALIMLEPLTAAPMPEGHAVMDQFSKAFVPDTLFVRVGQPVVFKNSEDQLHNVTVVRTRTGTSVFNVSQNQGDVYTHTFEQPGEYDVTCDVHPGMRGLVVAGTTPFMVYADDRGAFALENIAPGQYKLRVSAKGRDTERLVEVADAQVDVGAVPND
jgi:plastocyanin